MSRADTVIVLAKRPQPGKVKTRLQSGFTPEEAAHLAEAALRDTLGAVRSADVDRRVLAFDGDADGWSDGFTVVPQPDGDLNTRLRDAFEQAHQGADGAAPPDRVLLVGMDTPQLTRADLEADWRGADAVLGLADDGGFWAIGLRADHPPGIFDGVPMSTDRAGAAQLARLFDLGLDVELLGPLRDIDLPADAEAVATAHPHLGFAACWRGMTATRPEQRCDHLFDQAYTDRGTVTTESLDLDPDARTRPRSDDRTFVLDVDRWFGDADAVDRTVVGRCRPPVLDLGCGPGRMVRALTEAGLPALGVDMSSVAVRTSVLHGGPALRRLVFERLPAEGRWGTALLMDGNIGIGGDVPALLARCRDLVGPQGIVVCEVDRRPDRFDVEQVVLRSPDRTSAPMPWARVGADRLRREAVRAGLRVVEDWTVDGRTFVVLSVSTEPGPRRA